MNQHLRDLATIRQSRVRRHNVHGGSRKFAPEHPRAVGVIARLVLIPKMQKLGRALDTRLKIRTFKQAPRQCGKLTNQRGLQTRRWLGCVAQAANSHQVGAEVCESDGMELVRGDVLVLRSLAVCGRGDI